MAFEPGDAQFVSTLDDASKKKAKEELNELNEKDRELAVLSFREWVLQQKWLKAPTSFEFLLRFIRARKFSQLGARQTLENYWTCKTKTPEWYRDVDPTDPTLVEIMKTGFYLCPPTRDKHGRRVIIERWARLDLNTIKKKWGVDNVFRAITMICDWLNRDENVQVNGIIVFIDLTDITMGHMMTLWEQENTKRMFQFYQNSLPCRMKGIQLYNEPTFFDAAYALCSPMMKQKTKDRMRLHGRKLTKVYEETGMEPFPEEYLPDDYEGTCAGSSSKIINEMIADMHTPEFRNYIKELSSSKYGVDLKQRKQDKQDDVPVASFRKLNVE